MRKLIMLKGLPGSGKSTWAKAQVSCDLANCTKDDPYAPAHVVRVNKDDIRKELSAHGWVWSKENERSVLNIRNNQILTAFAVGTEVVISDDTNFSKKHENVLRKLATDSKAEFEIKFFDTPVSECVRRDSLRPEAERVGEKVILEMYQSYLGVIEPAVVYERDASLLDCVICDLDGTIAIHNGRSPYDFEKCDTDLVNEPIKTLLLTMAKNYTIIYLSGRDDCVWEKTRQWLEANGCPSGPLYMRRTGDKRKDAIAKTEIFDREIRGQYNVLFCLDDRDQVVKLWRDMGLTCLQVNYGAF